MLTNGATICLPVAKAVLGAVCQRRDCRALACPEPVEGLAMTTSPRHCEERSDVAIAMTELATRMAMAIVHRGSDDAGA